MHGGKIRDQFGGFFGVDKMGHDYSFKGGELPDLIFSYNRIMNQIRTIIQRLNKEAEECLYYIQVASTDTKPQL